MTDNWMIRVDHVSKQYRLGMIGGGTLRDELQRTAAKLRGKEDPTQKIGARTAGKIGELFYALDDVSFDVKKGEAVGIIGHNGAGKSTILKLISQVTGPSSGTIELNGRVACMLEVGTGFHHELSGRENIYMNGAILGMTKTEIDRKIEDIIEFSECRQFIDTPVKRYSSGMYVKLAFSVAAHLDSEIMIMDEVLAVGDAKFQEKCLGRMGDEAHGGRTVLYVSHNMNTIRSLCSRVIVLDHGKKVYDGDVEQGITLYNGLKRLSSSQIDLEKVERTINYRNRVYTLKAFIVDTDTSQFPFGTNVYCRVVVDSPRQLENVGFFFQVSSISNVPVVRMNTAHTIVLQEGKNTFKCNWDISGLVPGKYLLSIGLTQRNSWGSEQILDNVREAYCFEIVTESERGELINWNPRNYGYYVGPKIKLVEDSLK